MTSNSKTPSVASTPRIQYPFLYRASRWPGRFLIMTGILHTHYSYRVPAIRQPFIDAIRDGYINQFESSFQRSTSFWFILAGAFMAFVGQSFNWYLFPEPRPIQQNEGQTHITQHTKITASSTWLSKIGLTQQHEVSKYVLPRSAGLWLLGIAIGGATAYTKSGFWLLGVQGLAILLSE
ncbi:hypothetical protein BGZ94_009802 [Podila epigama]|nr:hypothetical protein BGZ94_009802 [Podila epigama]